MPFDANLVLRDGTVDLDASEAVSTSLTRNSDGAIALDLNVTTKERGDIGHEAVRVLVATLLMEGIPTTYADTLDVVIQQSDNLGFGWETLTSFPTLYAYTRLLKVTVTTAFVAGDIGGTLTGGTTGDTGTIRWMHPNLLTVGKVAHLILNMDAADDLFDDVDEAVTSGVTGAATMSGASIVEVNPRLGGPNTLFRVLGATKRYLRGQFTASAGSNFGKVHCMLSPYPFWRL